MQYLYKGKKNSMTSNVLLLYFAMGKLKLKLKCWQLLKPLQNKKGQKNLGYLTKKQSFYKEKRLLFCRVPQFFWPFLFWSGFSSVNKPLSKISKNRKWFVSFVIYKQPFVCRMHSIGIDCFKCPVRDIKNRILQFSNLKCCKMPLKSKTRLKVIFKVIDKN